MSNYSSKLDQGVNKSSYKARNQSSCGKGTFLWLKVAWEDSPVLPQHPALDRRHHAQLDKAYRYWQHIKLVIYNWTMVSTVSVPQLSRTNIESVSSHSAVSWCWQCSSIPQRALPGNQTVLSSCLWKLRHCCSFSSCSEMKQTWERRQVLLGSQRSPHHLSMQLTCNISTVIGWNALVISHSNSCRLVCLATWVMNITATCFKTAL